MKQIRIRLKAALFAFHTAIAVFGFSLLGSIQSSYQLSLWGHVSFLGLACLLSIILLTAFVARLRIGAGIYCGMVTTLVLLSLPSILVDRTVYGPDSYAKAANIQRVLETAHFSSHYPGSPVFSSAVTILTGSGPSWVWLLIAMGVLSPLAVWVAGRRLADVEKDEMWILITFSCFLPLGIGTWLTTRSIFHPNILLIPLAVLFSGVIVQKNTIHRAFIALVLGFALILYHPLLALTAIVASGIVVMATRFEEIIIPRMEMNLGSGQNPFILGVLGIAAIYFNALPLLGGLGGTLLQMIGALSKSDSGTGLTKTCISTASVTMPCEGIATVGEYLPIIGVISLSGTLIGGTIISNWSEKNPYQPVGGALTIWVSSVTIFGMLFIRLLSPIILIRLLGLISVILFILSISLIHRNPPLRTRQAAGVYSVAITILVGSSVKFGVVSLLGGVVFVGVGIGLVILFTGQIRIPNSGPNIQKIAILLLLVSSVPILYPAGDLNSRVNQGGTIQEHAQVQWHMQYGDGSVAARTRLWAIKKYYSPTEPTPAYRGSSYVYHSFGVPDDAEQIRQSLNIAGAPRDTADYIFLSGLSAKYYRVVYAQDGYRVEKFGVLTPHMIKLETNVTGIIFSAGQNTTIVKTE